MRLFRTPCKKCRMILTRNKDGICGKCNRIEELEKVEILDCPKCNKAMKKNIIYNSEFSILSLSCEQCNLRIITEDEISLLIVNQNKKRR